jgi:hypothetical protein
VHHPQHQVGRDDLHRHGRHLHERRNDRLELGGLAPDTDLLDSKDVLVGHIPTLGRPPHSHYDQRARHL